MQRRVQDARTMVFDNWRKVKPSTDEDAQWRTALAKASIRDIVATECLYKPFRYAPRHLLMVVC